MYTIDGKFLNVYDMLLNAFSNCVVRLHHSLLLYNANFIATKVLNAFNYNVQSVLGRSQRAQRP